MVDMMEIRFRNIAAGAALALGLATVATSALSASGSTARDGTAVSFAVAAASEDGALARKIEGALEDADAVDASEIRVVVEGGVVELLGTVASTREIREAQQIAYDQGALVVDNKLQIPALSPPPYGEPQY